MSEQQPAAAGTERRRKIDSSIPTERSPWERHFTQEVIDTAQHYGWQPFHLRDRESAAIVRGKGFSDLVMFRGDQLIVAELKRDEASLLSADQVGWIDAFRQHVPAYEWRPRDWDEIESVLKHGTAFRNDGVSLPPAKGFLSSGQVLKNFRATIQGLAETIEDKEFDRGDRSQLRRMDPDNPDIAAFWRLIVRAGMPENPDIEKWGLVIHGMALMSHGAKLAHNPGISVGRALYQGGGKRVPFYSEKRPIDSTRSQRAFAAPSAGEAVPYAVGRRECFQLVRDGQVDPLRRVRRRPGRSDTSRNCPRVLQNGTTKHAIRMN